MDVRQGRPCTASAALFPHSRGTLKEYSDWTREVKLPLIKKLDTKFSILMDPEPIMPMIYEWDERRNSYMEKYLDSIEKLIPKTGLFGRIFRMTVTRKTIIGMNGEYMLPDRSHLVSKDKEKVIPPAMKANLNIIFNFLCNNLMKFNDTFCCSERL